MMLQRLRENLTLGLITLLPFHGLLVTLGTKVLKGPGHAPWSVLATWKEGLLLLILLLALIEIARNLRKAWKVDLIDGLIVALLVIAVAVSLYRPWETLGSFFFGFKYDFIPLIAFLMLRRVPWSAQFWAQAERLIIIVGVIVAAYGIVSMFLPQSFFSFLGYSDAHSLYQPAKPLAAFQQISDSSVRRIQSTFSGPNQLGLWLLIPFSVACVELLGQWQKGRKAERQKVLAALLTFFLAALFLTFSRSAWIGTFVILCVLAYRHLPRQIFTDVLIGVLSLLMIAGVAASLIAPSLLLRQTSTWGHVVRPIMALKEMKRYPLGMALGSAGPAANRTHEPCVFLERGADPSWARATPSLCVFTGDLQMQPTDHACNCALLPENWYLQIGVELGWVGFVLYVVMTILILKKLSVTGVVRERPQHVFLFFLGISVAALFLHAWEDSAVAYTAWILVTASVLTGSTNVGKSRTW